MKKEAYTYSGAGGSFECLYTFYEVAEIYNLKTSCLRKQVTREKFVVGKDIKKFGRTWVITEQAMVKNFGNLELDNYKAKLDKEENKDNTYTDDKIIKAKNTKVKRARSSKKSNSMNAKEEKVKDSWVTSEIKGTELKSFSFS